MSSSILGGSLDDLIEALEQLTEEQWKQILPNIGMLNKGLKNNYKRLNQIRDENIEYAVEAKKILNEFGSFASQSSSKQKKTMKALTEYLTKAHDTASVELVQLEQLAKGFEERAWYIKDQIKKAQEKFDNATELSAKREADEELRNYNAKLKDNQLAINEYNKAIRDKTRELKSIRDEMAVNRVNPGKLRSGEQIIQDSGSVSKAQEGGGGSMDMMKTMSEASTAVVDAGVEIYTLQLKKESAKQRAATDIYLEEMSRGSAIFKRDMAVTQKGMQTAITGAFVGLTSSIQDGSYSVAEQTFDNITEMSKSMYDNKFDAIKMANFSLTRNLELQKELNSLTNQQIMAGVNATAKVANGVGTAFGVGPETQMITGAVTGLATAVQKLSQANTERDVAMAKMEIEMEEKKLEALNDIKKTVLDDAKETAKRFLDLTKTIETRFKSIDSAGHGVGSELGMQQNTQGYTDFLRKTLRDMSFEANGKKYYLDNSPEDVANMQKNYASASGYNQVMGKEELIKMSQMGVIIGDNNLAATLIGDMDVFNKSVSGASDLLTEMYVRANKAGVSNKKFAQDLANNLKIAEKHTFKGGVKAMMEMSIWAQKTKFNMQTLDSMLDNIQKGGLEGLITQGAKLQVLGGHFAMGADPLAMMYEGWNDPESLGKRMVDMTRGIGKFDKKTGEVDISGGDAMLLRAYAEASGMSYDEARQIVVKRVKSEEINKHLSKNYTDEQKELIYNKAKLNEKTGKWEVTTNSGEIKDINSLGEGDWASIMPVEQSTNNYVAEILSIMKREKGIEEHNANALADETSENMKKNIEERMQMNLQWVDENIATWKEMVEKTNDQVTELNKANHEKLLASKDAISQQMDLMLEQVKIFNEGLKETNGNYMLALEAATLDARAELLKITKGESSTEYQEAAKKAQEKTDLLASRVQSGSYGKGEQEYSGAVDAWLTDKNAFSIKKAYEYLNKDELGKHLHDSDGVSSLVDQLASKGMLEGITKHEDIKTKDQEDMVVAVLKKALLNSEKSLENTHFTFSRQGNDAMRYLQDAKEGKKTEKDIHDYYADFETYMAPGAGILNNLFDFTGMMRRGIQKLTGQKANKTVNDGITYGNGTSMQVAASEVIPVNDGAAKIASSHPNDTAIFAKTGGPFDTLFNGVFGRVDDMYEAMVSPKSDPQMSQIYSEYKQFNNTKSNSKIEFGELRINGSLELKSGGKSIDIMSTIKENPQFLRDLTEILSSQLSIANNGGRGSMARSESRLF